LADRASKATRSFTNMVTGKEQEDRNLAKDFYSEGDRLFRGASGQPAEQRKKTFKAAGKQFRKAAEAAPGSALEQDALFMQAESLFFSDQLTLATDTYQKLQKEFPRNRHNDRVAARLFSISRYWIDTVKADDGGWMKINLTDSSRPRIDTDGHAIRVLDQIRYDDPTGRLADDATMAAAAEYIRQEKFEEADEFLTDLRETFSDSEHLFLAHLLGIRVKLEVYAGPNYSGLVLEEAETLVRQTRQRFPEKMAEERYGEMVARASAEIQYHRAEREADRSSYHEKQNEYGAARFHYEVLLRDYPDTPQAENARERLKATEGLPARPTRRLSWMTKIFPESRPRKPLEMTFTDDPETATSESEPAIEAPPESESFLR
jgi:outer membrane protein assembly factor BamD (BamD/ComL family)